MSRLPQPNQVLSALTAVALCSLTAFTAASCTSTPTVAIDAAPSAMYEGMTRDLDRRGGSASVFRVTDERQAERWAEMIRRVEEGELRTAEDHFYAGAILVRSSDMQHLIIAESLGRQATILGDQRGQPVAAEAVDRQAFIEGAPQTYGTQYVYSHVLSKWQIYELDPSTTDEDRKAAGLPPLAWFRDRVRQLNESDRSDQLRRDLNLPPVD